MSNEHNIDKLLKESFDSFSPEAPNVWQAVQQGVQAAQASGAVSSGMVAAAKGVSIKLISGVVIAALSIAGYAWYRLATPPAELKQNEQVIAVGTEMVSQTIQAETEAQPNDDVVPEVTNKIAGQQQKQRTQLQQHPTHNRRSQSPSVVMENETTNGNQQTHSEEQLGEPISVLPNESVEHKKEPVLKVEKAPNTKPTKEIVKEQSLPYNPYVEEGEAYEPPTIPGSFSPNNDGLNDVFEVLIENEVLFSLRILNEKGDLVFESKSKSQTWDGKNYKTGNPCGRGNYLYQLNYQYKGSDKVHQKSGIIGLF
jgi:gliding motility-associated-like protein